MFASIIRPFRAAQRILGRVAIEKREAQELGETRKRLLTFRAALERSTAMRAMLTERVARLHRDLTKATADAPEKRRWDWLRMDSNTLVVAIKDDLYEAEKQLFEEHHNFEGVHYEVQKLEQREQRLVESLARRNPPMKALAPANAERAFAPTTREKLAGDAKSGEGEVVYDGLSGQIDLIPPKKETLASMARTAINGAPRVDSLGTHDRVSPSNMAGIVSA